MSRDKRAEIVEAMARELLGRVNAPEQEIYRVAGDLADIALKAAVASGERQDLREHWEAFCDADPFPGSDTFADRMERAGLIECVAVDDEALESPFATERGIEPGGLMWKLTKAGHAALKEKNDGQG